MKRFELCAVGN